MWLIARDPCLLRNCHSEHSEESVFCLRVEAAVDYQNPNPLSSRPERRQAGAPDTRAFRVVGGKPLSTTKLPSAE